MLVNNLDCYSVSFEYKRARYEHLKELTRLKNALEHGPVRVFGEVVEDLATANTYLHITSWQTLGRLSRT